MRKVVAQVLIVLPKCSKRHHYSDIKKVGAGNRSRTCTGFYSHMALNHARLPIPPPRL